MDYYMPEMTYNVDHGYLEALLRGFKSGILKQSDYLNLVQCETLEGTVQSFQADIFQGPMIMTSENISSTSYRLFIMYDTEPTA